MENEINLLYVDDEFLNLSLFKNIFKKNFNVITAESGEEGLKILRENNTVSVVISDMKMPGMNGVDFIRKAKKDYPSIAYFILTGFDINDEIAAALDENIIKMCFSKPLNKLEIESSINEVLSRV